MKKIIALVLSVMFVVCMFSACGGSSSDQASENAITVTLNFETADKQFYSKTVTVDDAEPTVLKAVRNLMDENDDIEIYLDNEENPMTIEQVNDYVNDDEKYWDFKIGDEAYGSFSRASTTAIKDGDVITWGYMSTDEFEELAAAADAVVTE